MNEDNSASLSHGKTVKQVLGFTAAGLGALAIDLLVFNTLLWAWENPSLANLFAGGTALLTNFAINFRTFKGSTSNRTSWQATKRFSLVAGISVLYIYALFEAFLLIAPGSNELVLTSVRVFLIGSSSLGRFFLYRRWVF